MRKHLVITLGVVLGAAALGACAPPTPPPGPRPYLDQMYTDVAVTPQDQPLSYGAAPPIDPLSGPSDPFARPLDGAGNEIQHLWIADPLDNRATDRPAIVWVHGGGFRTGIGAAYGLLLRDGVPYAQRGYVGVSIEYRIDSTSDCQYVQDHQHDVPLPAEWAPEAEQCRSGITAAQRDTQAALRWVRRHAAELRVDPNRVAVGGFSAGAVTAANVAYRADDAGTWSYMPGDDPTASARADAAFGASGCTYEPEAIDAGDSPISLIHSELDRAVDYRDCVVPTVLTARAAGLVAELTSYCDQAGHAQDLYQANQAATDQQWTTFLVRQLHLGDDVRPPSAEPVCA